MNSSLITSLCKKNFIIEPEYLIYFDMLKIEDKLEKFLKLIIPSIDCQEKLEMLFEDIMTYYKEKSINFNTLNEFGQFLNNMNFNEKTNRIDFSSSVNIIFDWLISDNHFAIPFGTINGDFNCSYNKNIKSLENGPINVYGSYCCYKCNISTLKGSPKYVKYSFSCAQNSNLTSLKYGPKNVNGDYLCFSCNLKTLKGAPKIISGNFDCSSNELLKTLKYCPNKINGCLFCENCQLTKLKYSPKIISGTFNCSRNKNLFSLKNGPKSVGNNYYCTNCNLKSLKGSPEKIKGDFDCSNNYNLKSLKNCPKKVKGNFTFNNCKIKFSSFAKI